MTNGGEMQSNEEKGEKNVTVPSIAVNSNVSRHLESSTAMGEIHSGQNVHPPCQSAE